MEKVNKFFSMIDSGQEHLAKQKNFYMTIFTILVSGYLLLVVKPEVINLEFVFALAIAVIPIIALTSAIIDVITLDGKNFYLKIGTRVGIYLGIYFILNVVQSKLF